MTLKGISMADTVTPILEKYSAYTDAQIKQVFTARKSVGRLYDMMKYHLGWMDDQFNESRSGRGKSLRSTMCLLSCEAISGDYKAALPAAAAMELLHNFSLIHDDIEDGDEKRRHRDTLWKLWGVPQAINTGDAMDIVANLSLLDLDGTVKPQAMVDIMRLFNETVMKLCEGQYLDMDFQNRDDVSVDEYITMIDGKTGALIEASTTIGAIVATEDRKTIRRFEEFGHKIGIAFQIQDDILGIWGDPKLTGKSAKNDIRNKKKTMPVLYALNVSPKKDKLEQIYAKKTLTEKDVSTVFEILTDAGSLEYTKGEALRLKDFALSQLKGLPQNKALDELNAIGKFLVERDY
jgi:geranylgeranyl diphosphate synthase type I